MTSVLRAIFFEIVGLGSLWSIMHDLTSGTAMNRGIMINVRENPGGFYLLVMCKAAFVCFATVVILNAFGLIGDPFVWVQHTLPSLIPK